MAEKRARRMVETPEYGRAMRRMIAAWARRVAVADPEDLADLLAARDALDAALDAAVRGLHEGQGRSWAEIAAPLGMTRQAAFQRWGRNK